MVRLLVSKLRRRYGPQHWWPCIQGVRGKVQGARQRCVHTDEIIIGAILTQNTAWRNVEKALAKLKRARALSLARIESLSSVHLERLIKPSGYFRQKTKKLKLFAHFWRTTGGAAYFKKISLAHAREALLGQWGIGPETADTILCYALNRPSFVVDAYTQRLCREQGKSFGDYNSCKQYFERHLPHRVGVYQEVHALIVAWGKENPTPREVRSIGRSFVSIGRHVV